MKVVIVGLISLFLFALSLAAERVVGLAAPTSGPFLRTELIVYVLMVALAIVLPLLALVRSGRFALPHPFVHVSWTYLAPIFVGGSLLFIAVGVGDVPPEFIRHPSVDYPLTLLYVAIGIASLGVGALMIAPRNLGLTVGERLPRLNWSKNETLFAGAILLVAGIVFQFINFHFGLIGYQLEKTGPYTALFIYLGVIFPMGQFLVWYVLYSQSALAPVEVAAGIVTVLATIMIAVLAGNRGSLFSGWIMMVLACFSACRRPSLRQLALLLIIGCISLVLGFTVGTMFRYLKAGIIQPPSTVARPTSVQGQSGAELAQRRTGVGNQAGAVRQPGIDAKPPSGPEESGAGFAQRRSSLEDQAATVKEAAAAAGSTKHLPAVFRAFAARTNVLTHVAVLVSRRDEFNASMPDSLKSGILIGLTTALVPRALWPNKPIVGDFASHARLFFGFEDNSFAVTPFGDLLLNFGPAGIVPGMVILGALMSFIYATFAESAPGSAARGAIFVALLTQFSMEGFFSPILPSLLRVGLVAILATLFLSAIIGVTRRSSALWHLAPVRKTVAGAIEEARDDSEKGPHK
jgi:hypothetical protein